MRLTGIALAVCGTALVVVPHGAASISARFFVPKALVLAIAALAGVASAARARVVEVLAIDVAIAGWLGLQIAGAVALGGARVETALPTLCLEVSAALIYWVVRAADPETRERAIDAFVLTAVAIASLALLEASLGLRPWGEMPRRPVSTLGDRNFVAFLCAVALPFATSRLRSRRRGFAHHVAVAVLACVIVLCRTRTVWVGCSLGALVAAALALAWGRAPERNWLTPALALAVGVAAAVAPMWPGLSWTEAAPLRSTAGRLVVVDAGSGGGRLDDARLAVAMVARRPLGVGPRQWTDAAAQGVHAVADRHARPFGEPPTPQSDLARGLAETGVPGLALAAALALLLVLAIARHRDDPLALPVAASGVVYAAHALFDAPTFRPEGIAMAALVAGLAPSGAGRRLPARPFVAAALVVALLAVGVAAARASAGWLAAPGASDQDLARAVALSADLEIAVQAVLHTRDPRLARRLARTSVRRWPHAWGLLTCSARMEEDAGFPRVAEELRRRAARVEPHARARGAAGIDRRCRRGSLFRATDPAEGPHPG